MDVSISSSSSSDKSSSDDEEESSKEEDTGHERTVDMIINDVKSAFKRDRAEALEEFGLKIPTPQNENEKKKKKGTKDTNSFDVDDEELEAAMKANAAGMFDDSDDDGVSL